MVKEIPNNMNFTAVITILNILAMGAASVGFITNKSDASVEPVRKEVVEIRGTVSVHDGEIKVLKSETTTLKEDIKEIKDNVKEIKGLFYEQLGYNKPAVSNAPLITGTAKNGSPINEKGVIEKLE